MGAFFTAAAFKGYAASAGAFLKALPRDVWYALAIAALLFNTYGSLHVWFVHWQGWKPKAEATALDLTACQKGRKTDRATYEAASQKAAQLAHQARLDQESRYTKLAEKNDAEIAQVRQSAHADEQRYIATHRVRVQAATAVAGGTGQARAASASDGAGLPAGLSADSVVLDQSDLRACTDATAYAVKAHDWAVHLNDDKTAVDDPQPRVPDPPLLR